MVTIKKKGRGRPQIKVCGLTSIEEALACALLGANAIGCVFYPKSPRNVTEQQAKDISTVLYPDVKTVGVFVNETFSNIMQKVERCHLQAVQLHGQEPPRLLNHLRSENLVVIKALFLNGDPSLKDAPNYNASAFLVECGKGPLPGGNALSWNWGEAKGFGKKYPFILAGGLAADNVANALAASLPDAVDVSSGVEAVPGRKDFRKINSFMDAVFRCHLKRKMRRIF